MASKPYNLDLDEDDIPTGEDILKDLAKKSYSEPKAVNPEKFKLNLQKVEEPVQETSTLVEEDLSPAIKVTDVKATEPEETKIEEVSEEVLEAVVHNTVSEIASNTVKAQEELKEEIKQNEEETRMSAFDKMTAGAVDVKSATPVVTEVAGYYTPKNKVVKDAVSKDVVSKLPEGVVTSALKELTGKGASEVTGTIDLHVKADAIVKTVAAMVLKVKELTLEKIPGFNTDIFDTFINNIEGVSVINCYDAGNMPMTISNFRKAAEEKILNDEQNIDPMLASQLAETVATGYIGKSVAALKNAANTIPARVITLAVKRDAIPQVDGRDDINGINLIANCFTSKYFKVITDDEEYVHIAVNLEEIWRYAQSTFSAQDFSKADITLVSATPILTNNILSTVVFKIIKE